MTKGKPWSSELEKELSDLVAVKTSLAVIAKKLGKPEEAVRVKIRRLGLEVVEHKKIVCSTTTAQLVLPKELFSVEDVMKELHAAVMGLKTPGLDKTEVIRLRGIIAGCKVYKEMLADYMDYRGLEAELLDLRAKYEGSFKDRGRFDQTSCVKSGLRCAKMVGWRLVIRRVPMTTSFGHRR